MNILSRTYRSALALCLCACVATPTPLLAAQVPAANAAELLRQITVLSSDDFEGRSPGTRGEDLTVDYLIKEFKAIGLAPGNPDGSYIQRVPLSGHTAKPRASFTVGSRKIALRSPADIVAVSYVHQPTLAVTDSELVFVGYGVVAPEYSWDDYKGMDVRGKTLVMLINDPPVPDPKDPTHLDDAVFGGKAMTYYGRWTYKYEMAAKLGASAAIIIHETIPAAYPYSVVANSYSHENFAIRSDNPNPDFPPVAAWLHLDRARELLAATGRDLDALKASAVRRDFRPVPLGATVGFELKNEIRDVDSRNVIGKIEGSDPKLRGEYVVYSAHWDHFGWDPTLPGSKHDQIYHGAADNAAGIAALLALARAFKDSTPRRTVLFIATTAEERGWLGARYYAQHPLYPLRQTLANINIDGVNTWGRTRDLEIVGAGKSTMDDLLIQAAAAQGRLVHADHRPESGNFYRADQIEFAKVGVPVLYLGESSDYVGKPKGYADQRIDNYTAHDYHQVTDTVKADWDLSGAVEDIQLLFAVGNGLAQGAAYPEWKAGSEFKATRDAMMQTSAH